MSKKVVRELKRTLKRLQEAEEDIEKRDFEDALKELRKSFIKTKKFFQWLKENKSSITNFRNLVYGTERIEQLLRKAEAQLMELKQHYNDANYDKVKEIVDELEKYVIWELNTEEKALGKNKEVIQKAQEEVKKLIKRADKTFCELIERGAGSVINRISPTNFKKEKEKFIEKFRSGNEYNPQFSYKSVPNWLLSKSENTKNDLMIKLKTLNLDLTKGAGYILERKRFNLMITLNLLRAIGTPKITKYSMQLYGFPSKQLIGEAYSKLEEGKQKVTEKIEKENEKKKYSIKEFKEKCEQFLKEHNFKWTVVVGNKNNMGSTTFKTNSSKKQIWVNEEGAPFSEKYYVNAMKHEVMVHARRNELGNKHFLKILGYGTSGYLTTEEGLTHYYEALKDAQDEMDERKKYLYVIVESIAIKGSFFDCVKHLVENGVEPGLAFDVVQRVKRGLSNTKKAGGFMKDHVYFLGDKIVKKFIAAGGNPEDLLFGKVGISDVKHLIGKYDISRYI